MTIAAGETITASMTLSVPSTDYPTIGAALSWLAARRVGPQATVTIKVADGTYTVPQSLLLNHPDGKSIELVGNVTSPASCVLTASGAPTFDLVAVTKGNVFGRVAGFKFDLSSKAGQANNYTAVLSSDGGSYVEVEDCIANNWYYSFAARAGARMKATRCTSSNAGDVGFWAYTGGVMVATSCATSAASDTANSLGYGYQGEFGGVIEARGCTATGCLIAGFAALSNSAGLYYGCTSTLNAGSGFYARMGGKIEANGSSSTKNGKYAIEVYEDGNVHNLAVSSENAAGLNNAFAFLDAYGGQARVASAAGPLRVDVSDSSSIYFNTSGGAQAEVLHIDAATSHLSIQGGAGPTGNQPTLGVAGDAGSISMRYQTKGAGSHYFRNGAGTMAEVFSTDGATDWLGVTGGAGLGRVQASGASPNVDIHLSPKGSGVVRFGAFTPTSSASCNGYISVKDSAGNVRKLMVAA